MNGKRRLRRGRMIGLVAFLGLAAAGGVAAGIVQASAEAEDAPTVVCPDVASQLPAVPAAAAADVDRELQGLENQIAEADRRLATSVGQGGPNFAQNAVLGPLADKRTATLERIEISIGRHTERPTGLTSLAECSLSDGTATEPGDDPAPEEPPAEEPSAEEPGNPGEGGEDAAPPPAAGAPTVACPDVASQLPAVPAAAAADVDRELQGLENQIAEANERLATSVGQGGPNFAQNAVLGPLADKRTATLERIEISIGRHAERPTGLTSLAECTLS